MNRTNLLEVNFQLDYKNKIIGKQQNTINFQQDNLDEIINSRTFCLFKDIEKIKNLDLQGGSLHNAVVVDDNKILNKEGLRNEKEFVNHKILDLAGDFLLYRILGKVFCYHGARELTNLFLHKIFDEKSSLKIFELEDVIYSKDIKYKRSQKLAVNA